jgi:hypothetical protein
MRILRLREAKELALMLQSNKADVQSQCSGPLLQLVVILEFFILSTFPNFENEHF